MREVTLPCHPGLKLSDSKLKSISNKYFSIPKEFLSYYPKYEGTSKPEEHKNIKLGKKRKTDLHNPLKKKSRKVGRPKKLPVILTGVQSITKYFRTV